MVLDNYSIDEGTDKMTEYYKVADFVFAVTLGRDCDLNEILPSFVPFRCGEVQREDLLFELTETDLDEDCPDAEFLDEDNNDMGQTRLYRVGDRYRIEMRYSESCHVIEMDPDFRNVSAKLRWQDQYFPMALCSLLRIAFAQAALMHSAVSLHSSVVLDAGRAVMFMGSSGTGKSTHSRLWIENIEGVGLLNDDNPIVRIINGGPVAYGSPWSGKTPCYRNESAPVAAMVRLVQAPENRFERKHDVEAFSLLLPGCSVLKSDDSLYGSLCDTLVALTEMVCVGEMRCLPDKEAALICRKNIYDKSL